jgi:hypothetical protein
VRFKQVGRFRHGGDLLALIFGSTAIILNMAA